MVADMKDDFMTELLARAPYKDAGFGTHPICHIYQQLTNLKINIPKFKHCNLKIL